VNNKLGLLAFASIYFIFGLISLSHNKMKIDEFYNHYPTVTNINNYGLSTVSDTGKYIAANNPLPYFLTVLPARIFGIKLSLRYLRIFNTLVSFFTILLIFFLLIRLKTNFVLEKTLIIFFFPYFLKPSFTYYMAIYGLLFYILFIKFLLNEEKKYLLSGIFIALAIFSQQFYLSIYFGMVFILLVNLFQNKLKWSELAKFTLPTILLFTPLVYIWKGVVPPSFNFHSVGIDLTKITSVFVSTGVIFLPFVFYELIRKRDYFLSNRQNFKILVFLLIIAIIFAFLFYPDLEKKGGYGKITGITFNFLYSVEQFNFLLAFLLKVLFIFTALTGMSLIFFPQNIVNGKQLKLKDYLKNLLSLNAINLLKILIFFFALGFSFNILLAERHLLPLIVTILLYHFINFNNLLILRLTLGAYILVGSIYFYYYLFIQESF